MRLSKKFASALAVLALGISTLIAAPAQAATQSFAVDCASGGSPQSVTAATGDTITLTVSAGTCGYVSVSNSLIGSDRSKVAITGGGSLALGPTPAGVYLDWTGDGTAITQVIITLDISGSGQINFTSTGFTGQAFNVSSGGGGGSSSSSSPAPQTFNLPITPTDGTTCANTSPSGTSGTWITLPAANDCTTPPGKPGATLLGWATNPNFPVDIAQRQVDNGWGAYETFNADGQLTGVFIPAGGATFLSAAGKLYPIWSE